MTALKEKLASTLGSEKTLEDFFGKKLLLFFYPKDMTPGCTGEAKDFSALKEDFEKLGIHIVGVSPDSIESHLKFVEKESLTIELLSDPSKHLIHQFKAWGEKKNYGKTFEGLIRSTFLLDEEGKIIKEWRNVRAKGHAERILKLIQE